MLRDEVVGVLGALNGCGQPAFDSEDAELLADTARQVDTAVFENRERLRIREAFGRYVHPEVVNLPLERGEEAVLEPRRRELTVLFSDVRGFTAMSREQDPVLLVSWLDEHLAAMAEVVIEHRGTVDKFVGDAVMAIFGAPLDVPDHAERAVRAALAMQRRHTELTAAWVRRGWPRLRIGIGISTGPAMVGNIGSERITNYTAIGPDVNLAARLCAEASGGQILLAPSVTTLVSHLFPTRTLAPLSLKGIAGSVVASEISKSVLASGGTILRG